MFNELENLPTDPILGLTQAFKEDKNPVKIDLGVGVYKDDSGNTPIMHSIKKAEELFYQREHSKVYTAPEGIVEFITQMENLVFGGAHIALSESRVATVQTPGGCGALRLAAELIMRANPAANLWLCNPSWANHRPLLGNAGLTLKEYPYFDATTGGVKFDEMMEALKQAGPGDVVLLHACCHNPTGADLDNSQWQGLAELADKQGFIPFIDMAYQGFAKDTDADAYGIRLLAERLPEVIVATSCSKNFALYRERVGAISIVTRTTETALRAKRQVMNIARGIYSMPPAHGAALVAMVLADPQLKASWLNELGEMRERINALRTLLVSALENYELSDRFSFIETQFGMFSFLGLSPEQVQQLRSEFAIYMTDNSRINIAGINDKNVGHLANAISQVV